MNPNPTTLPEAIAGTFRDKAVLAHQERAAKVLRSLHIKNLADCPKHVSTVSLWLWSEWGQADGYHSPADTEYRTQHCLGRDNVPMAFVALLDAVPVATVSLWTCDLQARQDLSPWLAALYVVPEMRRYGIGAAMVNHATEAAKMLRAHAPYALHLITDRVGYYEALGWEFVEEAPCRDRYTRIYRRVLRDFPYRNLAD
jgi:GNAT superfamily N-acetyltransferase